VTAARRLAQAAGIGVAGYLLYSSVRLTLGSARTVGEVERNARPGTSTPPGPSPFRFVLILPMLREDRIVADTCRRFAAAAAAHARLDVVVATSRSETADRDAAQVALRGTPAAGQPARWQHEARLAVSREAVPDLENALRAGNQQRVRELLAAYRRPTTAEIAAPLVEELNKEIGRPGLYHVSVTDTRGTKAEKINLALAGWRQRHDVDPATTYVGVYDADSAPDPATFAMLETQLAGRMSPAERPPPILQQVSCYCRNMHTLTGVRGVFSLADAIAQTRWALGFEYPLYRRYSRQAGGGRLRPLAYCVGHGCFVSLGFLHRIGGFPDISPTDDLALGYLASALGAEISPVPALDYCEVAPDPVRSMRQSRFWFSGSARFWRDLRHARRTFRPDISPPQWAWLHVDGFGRNAAWAGRGPAWAAALVLAVTTRQWRVAALLAAAHVIYVQGGYLQTIRALRRLPAAADQTGLAGMSRWRLGAGGVAASGTFILRSLGPFTGLARLHPGGRGWKHER